MKHRICKVTGYCECCGLHRDYVGKHPLTVGRCWSKTTNVVSLAWWRKLKAHHVLKSQLERSVAQALLEN